jgi:diaminohydroxyphosphoribosylaminopyrimidine deaminase/5-amino-6-(5-phosphoribosylamino)uracil reductase
MIYFCCLPMELIHANYMRRCLQLASLAAGNTAPNPMVGAVLVNNDRIIGEGFHEQYGQAHAEVNCLQKIHDQHVLENSTLYVSLEPCAHFGKTPPCADLIISKGIKKVVIGCRDPFEQVNGKGIEKLVAAGIDVTQGILETECMQLNKRFFTFHLKHRPYIILKWAESSNGMMASTGSQRSFISNEISNRLVHKWRAEETAILVGTETALADNPSLTTRLWKGKHPVRVVIDMNLRLPSTLHLFDGSVLTVVFNGNLHKGGENILYYQLDSSAAILPQIADGLFKLNLQSVIVEGGAKTLQAFIDAGYWDEARIITNHELRLENGKPSPAMRDAVQTGKECIMSDTIRYFKPLGNQAGN